MKDKFYKNKDGIIFRSQEEAEAEQEWIKEQGEEYLMAIWYGKEWVTFKVGKDTEAKKKAFWAEISKYYENKEKLKTMEETFLDRLKKEIAELEDKTSKLRAFIGSDLEAYKNASHMQKRLLSMQLSTMHAYLGILELRLMELE